MKPTILKISTIFLLLSLMGAGCEKDENSDDSNSIVGKWQLIQFPECVDTDEIIEITPDSVLKKYIDGELDFTSTFSIKPGSMGYDTIFYHSSDAPYDFEKITLIGKDTLQLVAPVFTIRPICDIFKRKR